MPKKTREWSETVVPATATHWKRPQHPGIIYSSLRNACEGVLGYALDNIGADVITITIERPPFNVTD